MIERGDRVALIGPNGAGKSTMMRMLSGVESPDAGERVEGHQLVMQYFAQDEATVLNPDLNIHDTLAEGSPVQMVPMIRNILGGFLFSGDDIYKRVGVLSGGERTRLAVARMLLRPANTLLLDEPTNHLDMDSKDVLLDALADFGGTLILVSHDRYFIDKLATRIIDIGHGEARIYPGTYEEYRWSQAQAAQSQNGGTPAAVSAKTAVSSKTAVSAKTAAPAAKPAQSARPAPVSTSSAQPSAKAASQPMDREEKKKLEAEERRRKRAHEALQAKINDLEGQIAEKEKAIKDLESTMAAPGFYENRDASQPVIDKHQALMWEVGDLMHRWETLQETMSAQP
jgi:ATP-binding cassette subfamily F protein 3